MVLVSLDGFRHDYLDRGLTPALSAIAAAGVRARALVPAFPTKTFPNHYTIVTGLYPGRHGIVGNEFSAPDLGARFSMHDRAAVRDQRFWLGEPVWTTAERHGLRTAPWFWPGSEAAIGGTRPTWWAPYDHAMPDSSRVRRVLDLLRRVDRLRPAFLTLYLSLVDQAGHEHGPDAGETDSAIARADRIIAMLDTGLAALPEPVNLVVISDHGMAAVAPGRVVWLDDLVRRHWLTVDELSPALMAWPAPGREREVLDGLRGSPRLTVYRRAELPTRWRLGASARVPPVVALADEGWTIAWRPAAGSETKTLRGEHGYDNAVPAMAGVLLARGPAFRRGARVPAIGSVHLYSLLAELLGVPPAATDASPDSVRAVLAAPGSSAAARPAAPVPVPPLPGAASVSPAPR